MVTIATILAVVLVLARPADAQSEINVVAGPGGRHLFQDLEDDGRLRLGDRPTARFPLADPSGASTVGKGHLDCVVQREITDGSQGPAGLYRCSYLLRLADGDLIIEGLDPHGPGVYTMAVLGGTGAFAGATGEATLTDGPVTTEFVIRPPS